MALLEIRNLVVEFATIAGAFRAVDGIDISLDEGELLGVVGESGSGKSVTMLALMGLLPWTAKVTAERLEFAGQSLLGLDAAARRAITGKDMAMIFQEPMTSLNPCFTVGFQIMEALKVHLGGSRAEHRARAIELLEQVGIPSPEDRLDAFLTDSTRKVIYDQDQTIDDVSERSFKVGRDYSFAIGYTFVY